MPTFNAYLAEHPEAAPKRKVRHPEWTLQTKIKGFVREFCAIPHEFAAHDRSFDKTSKQHIFEAERGIRRGWMDTELAVAGGKTFRCELKWGDNKVKDTDEQGLLIARMNDLGHPTTWASSVHGYLQGALRAGIPFHPGAVERAARIDEFLRATFDKPAPKGRSHVSKPRASRASSRGIAAVARARAKGVLV